MLIFESLELKREVTSFVYCIFRKSQIKSFCHFISLKYWYWGKGVGKGGEREAYVKFNIETGWSTNLKNINLCNLCGGSSMSWGM